MEFRQNPCMLANLGEENRGTGVCILAEFSGTQHINISLAFINRTIPLFR